MSDKCEVCECDPCDCEWYEEDYERLSEPYAYINYKDLYYVPRAPSLCEAREREFLFKQRFGVEPLIVGPFEWEILSTKMEISFLEDDDV